MAINFIGMQFNCRSRPGYGITVAGHNLLLDLYTADARWFIVNLVHCEPKTKTLVQTSALCSLCRQYGLNFDSQSWGTIQNFGPFRLFTGWINSNYIHIRGLGEKQVWRLILARSPHVQTLVAYKVMRLSYYATVTVGVTSSRTVMVYDICMHGWLCRAWSKSGNTKIHWFLIEVTGFSFTISTASIFCERLQNENVLFRYTIKCVTVF